MMETTIVLIFGILSLLCLNLYGSTYVPETYAQKMRSLGNGINLCWKDDDTGEVSEKKFILSEMKSREMKALEKELTSIGSKYDSSKVHEYRDFKVHRKMAQRADKKRSRERMRDIASKNGLDFGGISIKKLDEFISDIWGKQSHIIGYD